MAVNVNLDALIPGRTSTFSTLRALQIAATRNHDDPCILSVALDSSSPRCGSQTFSAKQLVGRLKKVTDFIKTSSPAT